MISDHLFHLQTHHLGWAAAVLSFLLSSGAIQFVATAFFAPRQLSDARPALQFLWSSTAVASTAVADTLTPQAVERLSVSAAGGSVYARGGALKTGGRGLPCDHCNSDVVAQSAWQPALSGASGPIRSRQDTSPRGADSRQLWCWDRLSSSARDPASAASLTCDCCARLNGAARGCACGVSPRARFPAETGWC